jgi:adenylate cyclase
MAHRSVRARLLTAFFGISAFAVVAAIAAFYAFSEVGGSLETITERRVPAALAAQELARHAERMVAAAPALLRVSTATEYEQLSAKVTSDVNQLNDLLTVLKNSEIDPHAVEPIEPLVKWLGVNLISLNNIAFNNLSLVEKKKQLLSELTDTYSGFRGVLLSRIRALEDKVSDLRRRISNPGLTSGARTAAMGELSRATLLLLPLQNVRLEGVTIHNALLRAGSAESRSDLEDLAISLEGSLEACETSVAGLEPESRQELLAIVEQLRSFTEGRDSIPLVRERQLENSNVEEQLAKHLDVSGRLTAAVDRLVAGAKHDITLANEQALSVQRLGRVILITVVVLSLISSTLIVWLYVERNLIARLTALTESTLAVAGGNLTADIPVDGGDEIGRMSEALTVFRNTAAEVEEANLQVTEARQRLLDAIESISDGFALYDDEDRLVLCNSRYRSGLHSGEEDELSPGMTFEMVARHAAERGLVLDAKGRVDAWVAERMEKHRNPTGALMQQRADGRWVQVTERKGTDGSTVVVYTDISELKQREQELAELVEKLEIARDRAMQAARAKSTFLANMGHELRTPLNAIIGFSEVLLEKMFGELNEKQEEYLRDIFSSGTHLLRLINDILDLSSIEAGRIRLEPSAVNLPELLQGSLVLVKEQALKHGISLDLRVDDGVDTVVADEQKVKRIVYNMLSNAVKFTPNNGKAGINARRTDEGVEIAVWDTGVGITPEDQGRIFEEFQQLGDALSAKPEGTGLGLTLTKKLVELHGGKIWVKSTPGEGSTFTFTLPPKDSAGLRKQA